MQQLNTQHKYWFMQERLIFGIVFILCLLGVLSWFNINEQEDPFFPYRNGLVTIVAPGMSATAIEDTIVQPFERQLANVDGLERVSATVSEGNASVNIELDEQIYDTELVWQRVREEVSKAHAQFGHLTHSFELNDKAQDTAGILLAIEIDNTARHTQHAIIQARRYALYVRDELYKMAAIRKIDIIGAPDEQIIIEYPQEQMLQLGISPTDMASQIQAANSLTHTGQLQGQQYQSNIGSITRIDNLQQLKALQIETADQQLLNLSDITQISTSLASQQTSSFWVNGKRHVGLSIVIPPNQLRVTQFGEQLLTKLDQLNRQSTHYQIKPIFFQPQYTQKRRDDLASSLLYSSVGVGLVLFVLMSHKVALAVTITIPAIALSAIAIFGISGGVMHQMSIAGLVISLGLMVDNSIVMSELIARYRQAGLSRIAASRQAIKDLYKPLATSTFTTIAAFIPMLLSKGNVADFIRMIPVIVIIAIITSYIYAVALLPAITNNLADFTAGQNSNRFDKIGATLARLGARYPKSVIGGFLTLMCLSVMLSNQQTGEFFPKASRNQAYIDIESHYGSSHQASLQTVKQIESILNQQQQINRVISFVGNSGSRFYYNLSESPNQTHRARVVFETVDNTNIPALVESLNQQFAAQFKSIRVIAREIGQGPPIEAPIEIRILGDDRNNLLAASEAVYTLLNQQTQTFDVRRDYILGKPTIGFDIDQFNLNQAGIKRSELSNTIAWRTTGINVTSIPSERESIDVLLKHRLQTSTLNSNDINNTLVLNRHGHILPLSLFAQTKFVGEAPVLNRWNGFNAHIIKSEVQADANAALLIEKLQSQLNQIAKTHQVTLDIDGEAQEQSGSNAALLKTLPIGAILLFGALILQFNSYRIALLIMLTIPLAMIGVNPTLSLVGVSFGFMSVLGLLALTGIVVNTAIILIDSVLIKVKQQQIELISAIEQATKERFRPVILTACTTTIGMLPLTSPTSPLWPPMAWTIIGGLITSTLLTLIVLPAFLRLTLSEAKLRGESA